MKKRENWADLCKLIGIFFMVWGHAGVSTEMDIYLHSFHMPIFFFLSGYWFSPGKYGMKEFLKRRAKSLLGPYLFYGAALCVLWNVYSLIAAPDQFVPWEKIAESLFLFNADFSPFAAVQWFLTALFLSEVIFSCSCVCCRSGNGSRLSSRWRCPCWDGSGPYGDWAGCRWRWTARSQGPPSMRWDTWQNAA